MFSKVLCVAAVLAVARAGLLVEPHHSAPAVSSQSIVRHDEQSHVAKYAVPVAKYVAPIAHYSPVVVSHAAPQHVAYSAPAHHVEEHSHPKYEFEYKVSDPHTGDDKIQHETRDGDFVKGAYSFHEADGSIRTVEYTADDHNGFNAVVSHSSTAHHNIPTLVKAVPAVKSLPVYHH